MWELGQVLETWTGYTPEYSEAWSTKRGEIRLELEEALTCIELDKEEREVGQGAKRRSS